MTRRLLLCQILVASLLMANAKVPASSLSHAKKGKKGTVEAPSKKSNSHNNAKDQRRVAQHGRHQRQEKEVASKQRKGKFAKEVERESPPPPVSEPVRVAQAMPIVPDRIQVIESGWANALPSVPPPAQAPPVAKPASPPPFTPIKKIDVEIPTSRVIEIQQALAKKGFYSGEPSGVYDDATIDAMRRFQAANQIGITGYPTAQALKRLGLTNW